MMVVFWQNCRNQLFSLAFFFSEFGQNSALVKTWLVQTMWPAGWARIFVFPFPCVAAVFTGKCIAVPMATWRTAWCKVSPFPKNLPAWFLFLTIPGTSASWSAKDWAVESSRIVLTCQIVSISYITSTRKNYLKDTFSMVFQYNFW